MNIIKDTIRKVKNRAAYKVTIDVIKDSGSIHNKNFIVWGTRSKAVGQRAMHLRNVTQKASVVNF
jgi:translation initiation factor IF-2